jgi:hypothetical protein
MKRQFFFGTMFSAALAVGAAAQTGSTPPSQSARQNDQQSVTVSGCLMSAADAAQAGRTGTAGTGSGTGTSATGSGTTGSQSGRTGASSSGQFVLMTSSTGTSAATGTGTGTTGSATSGTSGAASQAHKGYRLAGGEQQDLRQYVNNRVEVTGTLQGGASAAGSATASGTGAGSTSGSTSSSTRQGGMDHQNLPMLRVTSVRKIADSCSGDNR